MRLDEFAKRMSKLAKIYPSHRVCFDTSTDYSCVLDVKHITLGVVDEDGCFDEDKNAVATFNCICLEE